ncbi:hypothetical protein C8R27_12729 [Nitrosomonas ureae]|uniref:dockerin type I domain-containing protein n=1 Tax=Nitrosomonas ureae TaxID=44577 RepID=UPI000D75321E|nr:dockerin type I domain-containing protein [Nitrosomonas ureae]PXX11666.1 hypothetical protein C8R27_12729 [Nitrosomonas ureae]
MRKIYFYVLITALLAGRQVYAQHLDIEVWGEGNALFTGYCRTPGVVGCDLGRLTDVLHLPVGTLPIEAVTGKLIFLADFQDLPGGDFRTKNPGFQSIQHALLPNELLSYRAVGNLKYWDAGLGIWKDAPPEVQISLFGGLEASADVLSDFLKCAGQLICFSDGSFGVDGSTVFTGEGIQGKPELVVDITDNNGILHTHLSFFLENRLGEPGGPDGAYRVEMQLISNARFFPSEPFLIVFNAGLEEEQFAAALLALTGEPSGVDPPPQPIIPVSIPGDVDLDGDVDRIDVALILLAAQNSDPLKPSNAAFDIDGDGVITRNDASVAKDVCSLRLCNIPIEAPATALNVAAVFDSSTGILNLNDIQVGDQHYRAQLQLQDDHLLVLKGVQEDRPRYAVPAQYHIESGTVEIASVYIHGKNYKAILSNVGNSRFRVDHLEELNADLIQR